MTALAMMLARAAALASVLLAVPPTLGYLGPDRFGVWVTISTLGALLGFMDFGLGQGLMNALARSLADVDAAVRARLVVGGICSLLLAGLFLAALAFVLPSMLPLDRLLHLHSAAAVAEAESTLRIYLLCFAATVAVSSVSRIQLGLRYGVRGQIWLAAGLLGGLLALLLGIRLQLSMPWLVLAQFGTPLVATALNAWLFFRGAGRGLLHARPDAEVMATLLRDGRLFLIVQAATVVVLFSDNVLIAQALGPLAVTQFSVPARMFSVVDIVLSTTLAPLMPAYAEAAASGDWPWVRRTLRQSLQWTTASALGGALLLAVLAPTLVGWWVGSAVEVDPWLDALLAVWIVLVCVHNAVGVCLNGLHAAVLQIRVALALALVSVLAKWVLIRWIGLPGIPLAGILAWLLAAGLPYLILGRRALGSLSSARAEIGEG